MPRAKVTRTRKAKVGRQIVGLYGPSIGFQPAEEVLNQILTGESRYYVREGSCEEEIRVVKKGGSLTLVSTLDVLSRNNLFNLPDY